MSAEGKEKKPRAKREKKPAVAVDPTQEMRERIVADTKAWVRNAADERAVREGCVFFASLGQRVCDWIEENCYLYEGSEAGKPMKLIPYQREFIMRLFSWVQWSTEWEGGCYIRRFRTATLICAKKNGKTPFEAALGLYLTCADDEQGQKVYVGAKNGKQAQMAQNHAIMMVEQSPALKAACTPNRTTLQITHNATRSRMIILSGDDSAGAKAQEGINGSILIDELHVFDREMAERVQGAGISRKNPLNLAVSTAGDDPSSYGYERVEYGRLVNDGKKEDIHFLHVEYAVPPKTTDEELDKDPIKFGKMANPAWGYLVKETEFMAYIKQTRDKPRTWNRTKQYRFNLWVNSTNPWLNVHNWDKCRESYGLEDLAGRESKMGIDLARIRDMTGIILTFPFPEEDDENELVKIWPMFWLPRVTAELRNSQFPYLEWAEQGWITLTDGNVTNFDTVREDVCALIEENEITVTDIFFDEKYAEEMTQRMSDQLGANRTAVAQTLMTLSPLCKEVERRIDKGKLRHPGSPVMDWQVGHCQVSTDKNQNFRPVKPDPNSGKSIDGIMALVDTFAGVCDDIGGDNGPSISFF